MNLKKVFVGVILFILIILPLIKDIITFVFIPAYIGYRIRKVDVCPPVDVDKIIYDNLDVPMMELLDRYDNSGYNKTILYPYVNYKYKTLKFKTNIFLYIFHKTSHC